MDSNQDAFEELSPPTYQTLKTLERSWTGGSNDSVQQWVDSLTEAEFVSTLEERPVSPNVQAEASSFADVRFLPLPGGFDEDDLYLGAEAKSLSRTSSSKGFSPRLSPLMLLDDSENAYSPRNVSYVVDVSEEDGKKEAQHEGQDSKKSQQMLSQQELYDQKFSDQRFSDSQDDCFVSEQEPNGEVSRLLETRKQSRFSSIYGSESLSSIQGIPSLLAAMETDPEDVLRSLGFDQDTFASPIYRIPVRFLQNASEAKGIDTQKFYHQALEMEDKDSLSALEGESKKRLLSRFSQSSIDLSLVDYDDCSLTRMRRTRLQDTLPSITIEVDSAASEQNSEKNTPSRGSGNWRLSTVIEEKEPNSRKSSFVSPDNKFVMQKQANVDYTNRDNDWTDQDLFDGVRELNSDIAPVDYLFDRTDLTLRDTATRLEALAGNKERENSDFKQHRKQTEIPDRELSEPSLVLARESGGFRISSETKFEAGSDIKDRRDRVRNDSVSSNENSRPENDGKSRPNYRKCKIPTIEVETVEESMIPECDQNEHAMKDVLEKSINNIQPNSFSIDKHSNSENDNDEHMTSCDGKNYDKIAVKTKDNCCSNDDKTFNEMPPRTNSLNEVKKNEQNGNFCRVNWQSDGICRKNRQSGSFSCENRKRINQQNEESCKFDKSADDVWRENGPCQIENSGQKMDLNNGPIKDIQFEKRKIASFCHINQQTDEFRRKSLQSEDCCRESDNECDPEYPKGFVPGTVNDEVDCKQETSVDYCHEIKSVLDVMRQFSEDSLDNEIPDYKNDDDCNDFVTRTTPLSFKSEDSLKNLKIRTENGATRTVYRIVERKVEKSDNKCGEESHMVDADDDKSSFENIERKPRSWSDRLTNPFDKRSDSPKNTPSTEAKPCDTAYKSFQNNDDRQKKSSRIRDYFRRLATGTIKPFGSLQYINKDSPERDVKSKSMLDLRRQNDRAEDRKDHGSSTTIYNGQDNRATNSAVCSDGSTNDAERISDGYSGLKHAKSMQDVRCENLNFLPINGSAFCIVDKAKNSQPRSSTSSGISSPRSDSQSAALHDSRSTSLQPRYDSPVNTSSTCSSSPQYHKEVDQICNHNQSEANHEEPDHKQLSNISTQHSNQSHRLGKEFCNQQSSSKSSELGLVSKDGSSMNETLKEFKNDLKSMTEKSEKNILDLRSTILTTNRLSERKDLSTAKVFPDQGSPSADAARLSYKKSPEISNRVKPRVLNKGYSIESSGFEDEAEGCHSSPERGTLENGKRQLCSHCLQDRIYKPILETSGSFTSALSRDSLEPKSSRDGSEINVEQSRPRGVASMNGNDSRGCTPPEVDRTWADKSHFDYLVNQITALRKELSEQQERMEMYIDDKMERLCMDSQVDKML